MRVSARHCEGACFATAAIRGLRSVVSSRLAEIATAFGLATLRGLPRRLRLLAMTTVYCSSAVENHGKLRIANDECETAVIASAAKQSQIGVACGFLY